MQAVNVQQSGLETHTLALGLSPLFACACVYEGQAVADSFWKEVLKMILDSLSLWVKLQPWRFVHVKVKCVLVTQESSCVYWAAHVHVIVQLQWFIWCLKHI